MIRQLFTITGTTPAAASTAIVGSNVGGLAAFDYFTIEAALIGATGGVLDLYLQRRVADASEVAGGVWADWLHFPQLGAAAGAIKYTARSGVDTSIRVTGFGTDASGGTPALAANTLCGGHPGEVLRLVAVAGVSTSAGAAVTIYITGGRMHGRAG